MRQQEPITRVMTTEVQTIQKGEPLSRARRMLSEDGFHHLPVLEGGKPVGILTSQDMLRLTFDADGVDVRQLDAMLDGLYRIDQVMQTDLAAVPVTARVRDAAKELATGARHSVLVVEGEKLAGIVTSTDLIKFLLEQY